MVHVYKICPAAHWQRCRTEGHLPWSDADRVDGFIHLSAADQVAATAAKHFAGRSDLVLLTVDPEALPDEALRWEVSRGGARFPHLYGELPRAAVTAATDLQLDDRGVPRIPALPE